MNNRNLLNTEVMKKLKGVRHCNDSVGNGFCFNGLIRVYMRIEIEVLARGDREKWLKPKFSEDDWGIEFNRRQICINF